jgi:hypothetical protein
MSLLPLRESRVSGMYVDCVPLLSVLRCYFFFPDTTQDIYYDNVCIKLYYKCMMMDDIIIMMEEENMLCRLHLVGYGDKGSLYYGVSCGVRDKIKQ